MGREAGRDAAPATAIPIPADRGVNGPTDPLPAPPVARESLQLLFDPVFGPYLLGKLLSTMGIWIYNIVAAMLAYELSGSAFVVGLVSVAQFLPQILFAPLSGAMADRRSRRAQLVVGRLVSAVGAGALALAVAVLGPDGLPGAWLVVVAAFVVGIGFVIGGPAMNALVPSLVRPLELDKAVALSSLPITLARALGPGIGAFIAVASGPALAFAIAGAANAAFAAILMGLRIRVWRPSSEGDQRVRAGIRYLREDRGIILLLFGVAAVGGGSEPVITLAPALVAGLGAGPAFVGTLVSAFGAGAGVGLLVLSTLNRWFGQARVGTAGMLLMGFSIGATGLSPSPLLALVVLCLAGVGMSLALTSMNTALHQRVPEGYRGRVMGLWAVGFLGSRPVAAATAGALAEATSITVAFLLSGGLVVAVGAWLRPAVLAACPPPTTARHDPALDRAAPRRVGG